MTVTTVIMIIIGVIICIASFFVSEKFGGSNNNIHMNLMSVEEDYEFSDRELRIIRRKIEDVIANQAKDILYETNESLANMANEKTMALGDYAVAVCEQIEKNHKEVMFLYSMLDDKQKEIMKTVHIVSDANKEAKDMLDSVKKYDANRIGNTVTVTKQSAIDQLSALAQKKQEVNVVNSEASAVENNTKAVAKEIAEEKSEPTNAELEPDTVVTKMIASSAQAVEQVIEETDEFSADELEGMEDVFAELDQTDINFDDVLEEEFKENENSNDIILEMHRNGSGVLEIAKQLGLGVGEVKLVIDLYRGE